MVFFILSEKFIPNFQEWEWGAGIPWNGWEEKFPLNLAKKVVRLKILPNRLVVPKSVLNIFIWTV